METKAHTSGLGDTLVCQEVIRGKGLKDEDLRIVEVLGMKTRALSEADEPCYRSSRRSKRPQMKNPEDEGTQS